MPDAWMDNLRVVLVRARNPLNIGAAARAMSNFGLLRLRLVTPWEPSYHSACSAVGAGAVMEDSEVFSSVAEAVADCALVVGTTAVGERELQHPLLVLEEGAGKIRQAAQMGPVAILFGSEKTGLANAELSHCHFLMRIPTRVEHISMNLGQAVAICVYEIARGSQPIQPACEPHPAPAEQLERLTGRLGEALAACGYQPGPASAAEEEKLRRFVHRLALDKNDAEILLGMLRQMLWKMKHE
jgi:tRNA/rRNA methyltransferase